MERKIGEDITSAPSWVFADCKRAELVAYRARLGKFKGGREVLEQLRRRNEPSPRVELSIWINFAEGLLSYFQGGGESKADGVQRAYALSVAACLNEERAVFAAWLAQWDYSSVRIGSLSRFVRESLSLAGAHNHSARARASLVCAQALHLAGRLDLANVWYGRAKEHALVSHDDATIGALMHNMAWQRMLLLRQLVLTGRGSMESGEHALLNAESAFRFEDLMGDLGWVGLKPLLRAQIVSLQGDASAALRIYTEHLVDSNLGERWQSNTLADKAWCHAAVGQLDQARRDACAAVSAINIETQVDDRAATHSRLSMVFRVLGEESFSREHRLQADSFWERFVAIQSEIVKLLSKIDSSGEER